VVEFRTDDKVRICEMTKDTIDHAAMVAILMGVYVIQVSVQLICILRIWYSDWSVQKPGRRPIAVALVVPMIVAATAVLPEAMGVLEGSRALSIWWLGTLWGGGLTFLLPIVVWARKAFTQEEPPGFLKPWIGLLTVTLYLGAGANIVAGLAHYLVRGFGLWDCGGS